MTANERNRETHVLMRDLHGLLRDMQQRLPAIRPNNSLLSVATAPVEPRDTDRRQVAGVASTTKSHETEKPIPRAPKKKSTSKTTRLAKQPASKRRKKPRAPKKPTGLFEKHTPTLHKAVTALFRR